MSHQRLTPDEWFAKLRKVVPSWVTGQPDGYAETYLRGLATALSAAQERQDQHFDATFILKARGGTLEVYGTERSVERLPGEVDAQYAVRVQNVFNQSSTQALAALVNKVLINGQCRIREDFEGELFCSRNTYASRACVFTSDISWNTITIVIDNQRPDAEAFADRSYFCDRDAFANSYLSSEYVFQLIKKVVDDSKAFGTLYRVIELTEY